MSYLGRRRDQTHQYRRSEVLQCRQRRIAFGLLHQLGLHGSRQELQASIWVKSSCSTFVFECRQSTVMGNQATDLLLEVPYALQEHYFEPHHIQYLPLCIIKTQGPRTPESSWTSNRA